jgi:hypothetical protein
LCGGLALAVAGCGALNSSFVDLLDPTGPGAFSTLENAPGHVIVAFVNNAEVDERLVTFLESAAGGNLMLTDAQKRALRPRVRFRAQIQFVDGQELLLEFVSGSQELVQPAFRDQLAVDLNKADVTNAVVVCDVAAVQIVEPVEVFVPVELRTFQFVEPTAGEPGFFRESGRLPPGFRVLQVDDVDENLGTVLQRNIGIRDRPAPVFNPQCGTVIAFVLDGVLSVPFRDDLGSVPGFDVVDVANAARVGGRYEFRVTLQ